MRCHSADNLLEIWPGKTLFLIYALIECLGRKQAVALQTCPGYYLLFSDKTVTAHLEGDCSPLRAHPGIWMLTNASDLVPRPCTAFQFHYGGFIIQASSDSRAHWKGWVKELNGTWFVMDVPSPIEVVSLACVAFSRGELPTD